MVAAVELRDGHGVEHAGLVGGELDVVVGQGGVDKRGNLLRMDGVDLLVALLLNGGGLVLGLVGADHAGKRGLARGSIRDIRHGVGLAGLDPAAVDQDGQAGIGAEGNQGLVGRAGIDRAQAQQHLILRQVMAVQGGAGPLIVLDGAVAIHEVFHRLGVSLIGVGDELVAFHNVIVLAQLPRGKDGKSEVGKGHDEQQQ